MSTTSDNVRKTFGENDDLRDAGFATPDNIERFDNISYGTDLQWNLLDVYRPKEKRGEKLPVLINCHGGGWVYGDKNRYQYYCMSLAQHGFAVVNFSYRLAPEFKFPAPIEDMNQVVHWILNNADKYDFDLENIFAVGDSAGVNLLNLYIMICINPEYAKMFTIRIPANFNFKAVLLNCGAYTIVVNDDPNDLTSSLMKDYLPEGGSEGELDRINTLPYMTKEYPPAFVVTANQDFLQEEAPIMVRRLEECGVSHEFRKYGTDEHPLQHVFQCNIKLEEAQKCTQEECEFLKKYLRS